MEHKVELMELRLLKSGLDTIVLILDSDLPNLNKKLEQNPKPEDILLARQRLASKKAIMKLITEIECLDENSSSNAHLSCGKNIRSFLSGFQDLPGYNFKKTLEMRLSNYLKNVESLVAMRKNIPDLPDKSQPPNSSPIETLKENPVSSLSSYRITPIENDFLDLSEEVRIPSSPSSPSSNLYGWFKSAIKKYGSPSKEETSPLKQTSTEFEFNAGVTLKSILQQALQEVQALSCNNPNIYSFDANNNIDVNFSVEEFDENKKILIDRIIEVSRSREKILDLCSEIESFSDRFASKFPKVKTIKDFSAQLKAFEKAQDKIIETEFDKVSKEAVYNTDITGTKVSLSGPLDMHFSGPEEDGSFVNQDMIEAITDEEKSLFFASSKSLGSKKPTVLNDSSEQQEEDMLGFEL
jgi:hypothetical protein